MRSSDPIRLVSTFSIVARDAVTGDLGVAVESKFLAVGAVVPWLRAGVGAVATQAHANVDYGPRGLGLLQMGKTAEEVVAQLTGDDEGANSRQVGVVDARGGSASFTGPHCNAWAGGVTGDGFCCQGNILAGSEVVQAMADAYRSGTGTLANRLLSALEAGQAVGGDRRGQQSAAIQIVRAGGGYGGGNDRYVDLRIDDHPRPIEELRRLVLLHRVYFRKDEEIDLIRMDQATSDRITAQLRTLKDLPAERDPNAVEVREALQRFAAVEHLTERVRDDDQVDTAVMEALRSRAVSAEQEQPR